MDRSAPARGVSLQEVAPVSVGQGFNTTVISS